MTNSEHELKVTYGEVESKIQSTELNRREKEILKQLARGLRTKEAVAVLEVGKNSIDETSAQEIRRVIKDCFGEEITPQDIRKAVTATLSQETDQNLANRLTGMTL